MITTGESKIFHDSTGEKSGSQFADTMTHPARRVKSEFLGGFHFGGCYNLNMTPDSELLARLARTRSEATFAELVRRHVNLVYSTALRQVNGDAHLAQEVAQTIFTDLARNADSLSHRENLTGWLYTSAYFAAAKTVRGETHRRNREEILCAYQPCCATLKSSRHPSRRETRSQRKRRANARGTRAGKTP